MRSTSDLMTFAELYDIENESPFKFPDEFNLDFVPDTTFVDAAAALANFGGGTTSNEPGCAARHTGACLCADNAARRTVAPADNMGLVTYRPKRNWGGFDGGCEASFWGEWDSEYFTNLCLRLDDAKQASDDGRDSDSFIEFGGFVWLVRPVGAGVGFFKYKYVIESHGIKLYIHSNPGVSIPAFHVRFGFECLVKTDLFKAVETLKKCFKYEGFTLKEEKISRVDMQVLLPVDVSEFVRAMAGNRIVTRCRGVYQLNANMSTGKIETITVRSSNAELCIYDKRAEVLQSDAVYYETFSKWVLGEVMGELPDKLTRVEFRFRRGFLKRYGIDTFEQLESSTWALVDLASSDWFRILSRDKVRGSENEISDCELWNEVRRVFKYYFLVRYTEPKNKDDLKNIVRVPEPVSVRRVVSQGLGCLASACAVSLETVRNIDDVTKYINGLVSSFADKLLEKITLKQVKNEVVRGFSRSCRSFYDCLSEIQQSLTPVGEVAFLQYEGAGWEID